jgi:ATP-dependent 26S proteasome regulatory subunit
MAAVSAFSSSIEHLSAELQRIELKLQLQYDTFRHQNKQGDENRFRGLYISEGEVDDIIRAGLDPDGSVLPPQSSEHESLTRKIKVLEDDIAARTVESLRRGVRLRLPELCRAFNLSRFDMDVLLACVLPELKLPYQKVYAYLQDDITRKSPTVDFVLRFLSGSPESNFHARQAFLPRTPLIKYRLVYPGEERPQSQSLLGRSLRADDRVINYLLEIDEIDARLRNFTRLRHPETKIAALLMPDDFKAHLNRFASSCRNSPLFFYFKGPRGTGKKTAAEAVCCEMDRPLYVVEMAKMPAAGPAAELVPLVFREGRLQKAALYFENIDILFDEETGKDPVFPSLIEELENYPEMVFLSGEKVFKDGDALLEKPFININFPLPTPEFRRQLWKTKWDGKAAIAAGVDFTELANKFRLDGDQIGAAIAAARNLAFWRDPERVVVNGQDLNLACRQQSHTRLNTLARRITPKFDWEDIVLPRDQMEQLREICNYCQCHHTVYSRWGFDKKLSLGTGMNALFAGPSGTGKTMAAEIIAGQLCIELYKINISTIVSKYIGETEKNLEQIFREAETSNAILFFDEADALFGKRSEVKDSHDRYANIEIAYLLQRMEEYDGIVILATNMRKNLDEAFVRRLHANVDFPMPEEPDRYRIWRQVFPREAPLHQDIDFKFLARQFKISGGNIKNIALGAAFLAAADGAIITMQNLIKATKREYQKMGKLCTEADFAQFFELVKN